MFRRARGRLTYANVASTLALLFALGTGGAYAANTIGSSDIIDESIQSVDLKNGQVKGADIAGNSITSNRIYPGSITNSDIGAGAVDGAKVLDNSLGTSDVATNSLFGSDIFDGTLTSADIGTSAVASSEIANGSIVSADIASHGIDQSRIDGTDHYGGIGVGGISSGRCTTVTISIGGAEPGDAGMLTTDGTLPDGEVMYLQRVLSDSAHVKVCNLSGGDLPAVTVNARILTFH
jgi:hypothetical protein